MRQGETAPKGGWIGNASGGVKAPEPILLPDAAVRFARTAERLERLSRGHPMEAWLDFMAKVARAQHHAGTMPAPLVAPDTAAVDQAVAARIPPISADGHRRDPAWRDGLALLLDTASPRVAVSGGGRGGAAHRARCQRRRWLTLSCVASLMRPTPASASGSRQRCRSISLVLRRACRRGRCDCSNSGPYAPAVARPPRRAL